MTSTNITIITIIFAVSIALFGFVLAFLISSILTKDQVAADKRLDELKKNEGDSENYALVKHESRIKAKNKEKKKQDCRMGNYHLSAIASGILQLVYGTSSAAP